MLNLLKTLYLCKPLVSSANGMLTTPQAVFEEGARVVWKVDGKPIGELLNKEVTDRGKPGWRVRKPDGVYVIAEELMKLEGRIYVRCHNSGLSVLCRRGVVAGKITLPAQHLPTYMKQIPPRPPLVSWKSVKCFFYASSPRGPHAVF